MQGLGCSCWRYAWGMRTPLLKIVLITAQQTTLQSYVIGLWLNQLKFLTHSFLLRPNEIWGYFYSFLILLVYFLSAIAILGGPFYPHLLTAIWFNLLHYVLVVASIHTRYYHCCVGDNLVIMKSIFSTKLWVHKNDDCYRLPMVLLWLLLLLTYYWLDNLLINCITVL